MAFEFSSADEIFTELGQRIRAQRLLQGISQLDLAGRAGVSHGTVRNMEATGQASMASFIRIVQSLGLLAELEPLFSSGSKPLPTWRKPRQRRANAPRESYGHEKAGGSLPGLG